MIEGKNLFKSYENQKVLNDISFKIEKGKVFGLLGQNGAGKTTLIRIINQIIAPDKGHILFDGQQLSKNHISKIGYLPEERGLYKKMKVGEQSLYLAQLKGLKKTDAKQRLKFWFDKFEMTNWWDKRIEELSKGMAQKVQFVSSVLHQPKLLILDEPFSGFDPINTEQIKSEILELKKNGTTIIYSTHRMETIEELCDDVCMIKHGTKILDGNILEIKHRFQKNIYEIIFSGEINLNDKFKCISKNKNKASFQLNETQKPNDLINHLTQQVEIKNFNLILPSINEIFINQCKNNE